MQGLAGISTYTSDHDGNLGASRGLRARFLAATLALAMLVLVVFGAVALCVANEVSRFQLSEAIEKAVGHLVAMLRDSHHGDMHHSRADADELFDLIVLEDRQD